MAKKKTEIEKLLSDLKKSQKLSKQTVLGLEEKISIQQKHYDFVIGSYQDKIDGLEKTILGQKNLISELFGDNIEQYVEGYRFERFVARWMDINFKQYELKLWQSDKFAEILRGTRKLYPSWNQYPDLIYVDEVNKKAIALECKYRNDGMLELERRQYDNYKKFESQMRLLMKVDISVYIIGGSRGLTTDRPDYMYCIPLDFFKDKELVDFREIPEYKVYERGFSNVIKDNIPF